MAIIFSENFESGSTTLVPSVDNGVASISSLTPISGLYSARLRTNALASGRTSASYVLNLSTQKSALVVDFDVRFDSMPLGSGEASRFLYVWGADVFTYLAWDGASLYTWVTGAPSGYLGITAIVGHVYHVQVKVKRASASGVSDGIVQITIDGVTVYNNTAVNNYSCGLVSNVNFNYTGYWAATPSLSYAEAVFDNIVADDTLTASLTLSITPITASLLAGQSQAFHANVGGGTNPTVAWYEQGNSNPLGAGVDITLQFNQAGTFGIYAVATDPTAPNSPLQSNIATVTVSAPTYTLTITAGTGGTTNPSPGTHTETAGTSVQVTAIPNSGYIFSHWTTDDSNNNSVNATITVQMNTNHNLTAVFAVVPPTLYSLIVDSSPIEGVSVTVVKS